jgi:hypothetical protein
MGSFLPDQEEETSDLTDLTGKNWMKLRKVAELIGKSYQSVLKMKDADPPKIKVIKVGGQYRIYEEEVRRFLREGNAND